jgi:hypothetical protein
MNMYNKKTGCVIQAPIFLLNIRSELLCMFIMHCNRRWNCEHFPPLG